ncbi:histidine kinase N-terminal 7TM domain-containing protein [Halovivax limisalsi]|uniref:sensor histidine kinase n=1 Tax=Halovivax limisalsi TaxID=1453760 RepID=UPI001FFCAD8B|nr:histidine kinase N-terminal 7TM domain-containing protein [Halovivax limisalsi]
MELSAQSVYFILLAVATLVSVVIGVSAIRNRTETGATVLAIIAVAMAVWLLGDFLTVYASSLTASVRSAQLGWIGTVTVPTALFVYVLRYTGRERYATAPVIAGLAIVPVITYALVLTNGAHGLIWSSVEPAPETLIGFEVAHGPAFVAYTVYAYTLVALTTVFLLGFLIRSRSIYRGQAAALVLAIAAPWLGNVLYVSGLFAKDLTPLSFSVTTAALGLAMVRYRFADVIPVARDTVVDNITDGVFVLDGTDRLVDVNPGGRRLFGDDGDDSLVGRPAAAVFPDPLVESDGSVRERSAEVTVYTRQGLRYLAVDVTSLSDRQDRSVGRLLIARDVTERRRYERELERQNERLDRFASVVSHDLRNPLNVAEGYLSILAERRDDAEIDEIEASLRRMEVIIEDVLTLSRQGDTVDDRSSVLLSTLAERAWNSVETDEATLRIETGDHRLTADESRLTQAFENLFRNAVEHNSASRSEADASEDAVEHGDDDLTVTVGTIDEAVGSDGSSARAGPAGPMPLNGFYVADDGVGVPESEREAILESGYTTNADGTGLGLDIVRSIVEAHGWSLSVAESVDGGARFEVTYDPDRER